MTVIYLSDGVNNMGYAHGHRWTNQEVESHIMKVVDFLEIDRMPSRSEIEEFYGNAALTGKISKTGGFHHWADQLGLEVKESESKFGIELEKQIKNILENMDFKCEITSTKHPYDLLVDDCVKIDVKAARISKFNGSNGYSFRLAKSKQTCDVYVAVCVDDNKEIQQIYIIPAIIMTGKKQLCMGAGHSSYDVYIDRWDIIEKMSEAFHQII